VLEDDLSAIKLNEVVRLVESFQQENNNYSPLEIMFLRNITIDSMIPYLKYLCYREKFQVSVHMGDYDNILPVVMDKNSYLYKDPLDVIIICLKLETLSGKLTLGFSLLSPSEVAEESERVIGFIRKVISEIRKDVDAPVLIHNFEVPVYPSFGILDYQDNYKQVNTVKQINRELLDMVRRYKSIFVVDIDLLQSTVGYLNFIDHRFWHIGKAPYTEAASRLIAREYVKFIRALKGKNKKCLVLDCDNTLWGGIIGEDGINKIKLGKTYPGSAYWEFQQAVLNLYNRGIMLAVCSKNNESDVFEVMRKHPDMVLREKHFVSMKINWKDKATNLKEIADELNIGLDSLAFVDDSDFEINLVKKMLPEVKVIKLPKDISLYRNTLNSAGVFDSLVFSEEDRKRNKMYKAESKRKEAKVKLHAEKIEDYYRYLEIDVSFSCADEFSIPRVAQLTQKTNQFNLTTKRYSEAGIKNMSESNNADVLCLNLKDRFGDSGIVGVAILKYKRQDAFVDTFLLSCRAIGRGIEEVLLKLCFKKAIERNCNKIIGIYKLTRKNDQVKEFYAGYNFTPVKKDEDGSEYSLYLKDANCDFPEYFKSIKPVMESIVNK